MVVKTFRGLLAGDAEDRIRLQTIKGKVGYRIVKLLTIGESVGTANYEATLKINTESGITPVSSVNLTDSRILAVVFYTAHTTAMSYPTTTTIIMDREIFNQDIFITNFDAQGYKLNYYLELEVVPLDDAGAEYTTLKDMRQS